MNDKRGTFLSIRGKCILLKSLKKNDKKNLYLQVFRKYFAKYYHMIPLFSRMYILEMKIVQTFGSECIQGLNILRRQHVKGILI